MARPAGLLADIALQARLRVLVGGLHVAVVQDVPHAGVLGEPVRVAPVLRAVVDAHLLVPQPVEEGLAGAGGEVLPRGRGVDLQMEAQGAEDLRVVVRFPEEAAEDALLDGEARVLDERLGVDHLLEAQAVALRAGAVGGVEGEVARLQVVDGVPVLGAGERERVGQQVPGRALGGPAVGQQVDGDVAVRELGRLLDGLRDAPHAPLADHDAVHHDLDGVAELLVELDGVVEAADLAVDADAGEPLAAQVLQQLGELALAVAHHGREHEGAPPEAGLHDLVRHLVGGLALDLAAAFGAVRRSHAREQQAQVIVDLGHRAHRGARVLGGRLLVDGHRRRQPVDGVEVGLVHLAEELAGVARQALDVAALPLGVDRVEGEARLARAREAGDDDELVAGDLDVDVLEVVLAGAADDDG